MISSDSAASFAGLSLSHLLTFRFCISVEGRLKHDILFIKNDVPRDETDGEEMSTEVDIAVQSIFFYQNRITPAMENMLDYLVDF